MVLGGVCIDISDFLALKAGDLLPLRQKTRDDITMNVANIPKFTGRPALQGKKLVFTVSQSIEE